MAVKIREKPTGSGVWWVFINHHGRRKSKKVGDKESAEEVAKKINARLILGELNIEKINHDCPTFKQHAEKWIKLPHDWKESTRENYKFNLDKHIYPILEKIKLDQIKRKDLKDFFNGLVIKKLSAKTINLTKATINGVLADAVDSEIIDYNPLSSFKLKNKKRNFTVNPLSESEAYQLLEQAQIFMNGYYYPHLLCALRTGMRLGEMKALKWDDIDFDKRQIEVNRSCRRGRITGTKTDKRRNVDMTLHLTATLKQLKIDQKKLALKGGRAVSEWVFANKRGAIFSRAAFQNALNRCLSEAGLRKKRIHDLRHSYATIRLMRGHNVGDVSYQLGHSSIKMTYDFYTHWIPGNFKSEIDDLDNIGQGAPGVQNRAK